ncbi:hypothetical protein CR513_26445, partial [Mucuna pruriens]
MPPPSKTIEPSFNLEHENVFLDYKNDTKGYLYDLTSHEFFISRNLIFYEFVFPFLHTSITLTLIITLFVTLNNSKLDPTHDSPKLPISSSLSLSFVLTYQHCTSLYTQFCLSATSSIEPKTYHVLAATNTCSIVDLAKFKIPIRCKGIYKIKYHFHDFIERYKVVLVAKCYTQMKGADYFETFSLVAKLTTIRILISLVAIKGLFLEQLDVNNISMKSVKVVELCPWSQISQHTMVFSIIRYSYFHRISLFLY